MSPRVEGKDARRNREFWDADADDYQAVHGEQLARGKVWGAWAIPEAEVDLLGPVAGLDVLEYGCGGAQWSVALAREGATVVALDQSAGQLRHAAAAVAASGQRVGLVCASGDAVPFADESFDLVFCDHGAMSFLEPSRSLTEVARVLRRGGRLVFNAATLLLYLTWDERKQRQTRKLQVPAFGASRWPTADGTTDYAITHGSWIRAFRTAGFTVEDLVELRPPDDAVTTYADFVDGDWARRWPAEQVWVVRRT